MIRALTVIVLAVLAQGCSRHLRPPVELPEIVGPPRDLTVSVVYPESLDEQEDSWGRFASMGLANEWVCETGRAFTPALLLTLRQVFRNVDRVRPGAQPPRPPDLTLYVSNVSVTHPHGMDWVSVFSFQVGVVDTLGRTVFARRYEESDTGSSALAFLGGALVADEVLARPAGRAMTKTLEQLAEDLARVDVQPQIPQI